MGETSIEWADRTWNPTRGCTKISPGCKHCYAETFAERWRGIPGHPFEQGFDLRLVPSKLSEPLTVRKPSVFFVNSVSDLFHVEIPADYIAAVFGVMAAAHWHRYKVLTKRAAGMKRWVDDRSDDGLMQWAGVADEYISRAIGMTPRMAGKLYGIFDDVMGFTDREMPLPNVELGVSVEDRRYGLPRMDYLRDTPAAYRFVSIEPLLEDLGKVDFRGIDQVIVGAESGHGARPMHEDWVRSIRDQAKEAGALFFYKQKIGERGRKVSLPMLDGRQWAEAEQAKGGEDA